MEDPHGLVATKPWSLIGTIVGLSVLYIVGKAVYNVYFHPLHHIPGPKFAAVSRIPYIRHLLAGTTHQNVKDLHNAYGEVVRISPNEVSFSSGETAWPDIYGFRTGKMKGHANMAKSSVWYPPALNGAPSILIANDESHSRGRRILSHAFSAHALAEQEPLLQKYVDQLIGGLKEAASSSKDTIDMAKWYNWTTFDVVADLLFGEPFGCLQDKATHKHIDLLLSSIAAFNLYYVMSYWPWVKRLGSLVIPQNAVQDRKEYMAWVTSQTEKRCAREMERADFMTHIIAHNEKNEGAACMSTAEIASNATLMLNAGSETTATLLSATTYLLATNPRVMQKVKDEVRGAFKTYDEITINSASQLPYLIAVLEEGLRFFPPVPTGFERTVGKGGEVVSGYYIPEDTGVCVSQWPTHHSEANFKNPDLFVPERWMGDEEYKDDKRSSCQPFSFGPRNCLGKNLALAEMRIILAKMIWTFDFELDSKSTNWMQECRVKTVWLKPELAMHLTEAVRE